MGLNMVSVSYKGSIFVAVIILFSVQFCVVASTLTSARAAEFDIPTSELNKVKKKPPEKRVKKRSAKKKNVAKLPESSPNTNVPAEPAGQVKTPPVVVPHNSPAETVTIKGPAVSETLPDSGTVQIHHSPYSFVVAGKPTVIHAVVSSTSDIQSVKCSLHTLEGGEHNEVKMVKMGGTQFTYTATLPQLSPETTALRYTIIAVDSDGKVTRSKEFATPVTLSSVVPGWQQEVSGEDISVEREGKTLKVPKSQ